jgi:tetratricopeptide (TPR) repeat protein
MVDPTPTDYHLSYLRDRWERDRSSRVFLQLAEEYRRRGLHSEALEVLGVGLAHHPGYLAAQVSLGRCRLEAGQQREAVEVLERVLAQDPTQAVASRLMVEARLQLRDLEGAREAIARCRLLGVVPPQELQVFQERLASVAEERQLAAATAAPPPAVPSSPPALPTDPPPAAVAAPRAAHAGAPREAPPTPPSPSPPPPTPPPAAPVAAVAGNGNRHGEVFRLERGPLPPLILPLAVEARRSQRPAPFRLPLPANLAAGQAATAGEEIFALRPLRREPEALGTGWHRSPAPLPRPEPTATTLADHAATAPPAPPGTASTVVEEPPAPLEPSAGWWRPTSGVAPAAAPEEPTRGLATQEAAPALAPQPAPEPAPRAEQAPLVTAQAPSPAPERSLPGRSLQAGSGVEVQPTGSLPAPELRPSDPGTATLAELYLRQGHLREAEEIFRQVLGRDPENETALRGLEAIGRRRGAALTAADLVSGEEPEVRGVTSRKILLLERYLRALRRGEGSDVPRATE